MKNKILTFLFGLAIITIVFSACEKETTSSQKSDNKPASSLTPNISIKEIIALFETLGKVGNTEIRIFPDSAIILEAHVISSDETGNFYKTLYLEDPTGGIFLSIESGTISDSYPLGETVHLNLSELTIMIDSV